MSASQSGESFSFQNELGRTLFRQIARDRGLPFDPHDFSLNVAAAVLDQSHALVRTACGSGKTGTIALIATIMDELVKVPSKASDFKRWYPADFGIIVVCPTNALENDIAEKMNKLNIATVILNAETEREAQQEGLQAVEKFWEQATLCRILLLSPEMLSSDTTARHLGLGSSSNRKKNPYYERSTLLFCDEAHLVYLWGKRFREKYALIGSLKGRLHSRVRIILMSATLRPGKRLSFVLNSFGFKTGLYVDIHESNLRPEVRVTTCILSSSIANTHDFPDFRWVLCLPGISIIFVPDRNLALRITLYLIRCNPSMIHFIRKYDALNDKSTYDVETKELTRQTEAILEHGMVIVSTSILTTGMDMRNVRRVLDIDPGDCDEEIQRDGRVGREMEVNGPGVEAYTYVSARTMARAREIVDAVDQAGGDRQQARESNTGSKGKRDDAKEMDLDYARRLAARCRTEWQNPTYKNPPYGVPECHCIKCTALRPRVLPPHCICDGCEPGCSERELIILRRTRAKELAEAALVYLFNSSNMAAVAPAHVPEESSIHDNIMRTEDKDHVKHSLIRLDERLVEDDTANPGGLLTPGMRITPSLISTVIDTIFVTPEPDESTRDQLARVLSKYRLPLVWLDAIWHTLNNTIIPRIIKQYHERREREGLERLQRERQRKLALLRRLAQSNREALRTLTPETEEEEVKKLGTKVLVHHLRWYALWNPELPQPGNRGKDVLVGLLIDWAIPEFCASGRSVEEARTDLNELITQLDID